MYANDRCDVCERQVAMYANDREADGAKRRLYSNHTMAVDQHEPLQYMT
jgi:hypothetical protein